MATTDPFTGAESYNPNSAGVGAAIGAMQESGFEAPLAFRMMENFPGMATAAGFSTHRGTNTIMRGGFLDNPERGRLAERRMKKFQIMHGGSVSSVQPGHFAGSSGILGKKRATRLAGSGKAGFVKSSRVNNITARPRALGRFHSLSVFGAGGYTPFGASRMLGNSKRVQSAFAKAGVQAAEGESLLGAGLFSFVGAGRKADILERRALKGSSRAFEKLGTLDSNIKSLARMNNPAIMQDTFKTMNRGQALRFKYNSMASYNEMKGLSVGQIQSFYPVSGERALMDRAMSQSVGRSLVGGEVTSVGQVGVRGNLMASSMYGEGTRYMAGYFRGAQGFARKAGLADDALKGARAARYNMYKAIQATGLSGGKGVGAALGMADKALEKGVFKTLGKEGVIKVLGTKAGAKVLGARALAMAIPGLNIVATAALVYDLGKMAGEVVKSGINLAKDGVKSMKGTINKPLFGMGYKDTEVAATSRARGVMAIQNSQLNARSALGSEASMMAAHFG